MNLDSHFAQLLDLLVKSAALLLLSLLVFAAFRRSSAANRHAVAAAVFAALLLLPFTKLFAPHWAFALDGPGAKPAVHLRLPAVETARPSASPADAHPAAQPTAVTSAPRLIIPWRKLAVALWLAGAVLLVARRIFIGMRLGAVVRGSSPVTNPRVRELAHRLAGNVDVRESADCCVPIAAGVFRPVVLLPASSGSWSEALLASALRHELGHIQRRDCLTRLLADLTCAIYWLNPLAWFAARQMRLAQEQACDDLVLNAGAPAAEYAGQLVDVVRSLQGDRFTARHALAMAQSSTLETRVRAIVDETRDRSPRSVRGALAGFAFAATALTLCAAAQLRAADEKKAGAVAAVPASFGPLVEIAAKFIEITGDDPALVDFLKAMNPTPIPVITGIIPSEKADAALKGLEKAKGVDVLSTPRVTTKSKQRAQIEIVREFIYPTEWDKDAKGAWTPTAFEMKNVGVTFDVTPEVHAGNSIDLKMTPEVVEFEGFVDLDGDVSKVVGKPDAAKPVAGGAIVKPPVAAVPEGHRAQPVFHTRKMSTQLTVWPGQTIVLGGFEAGEAKPGGKEPRRLVVFVTAHVVDPKAAPAAEPKADGTGKVEVRSDEMTVDRKTGKMRASGNVKVETAEATITAAEVEITPKKTGAAQAAAGIIFPKVEFKDATLGEVVDFLVAKSKALDPEKKGVNIVIKDREKLGDVRITLSLADIPLTEVLRYVAALANRQLAVEEFAFVIGPVGQTATKPAPATGAVVRSEEVILDKTHGKLRATGQSTFTPGPAMKKAGAIMIPKIELRDATLAEAVDFLRAKAKMLDADKQGVNINLKPQPEGADARITLSLADVPLSEALRYVAHLAGYEVTAEENAIILRPVAR